MKTKIAPIIKLKDEHIERLKNILSEIVKTDQQLNVLKLNMDKAILEVALELKVDPAKYKMELKENEDQSVEFVRKP